MQNNQQLNTNSSNALKIGDKVKVGPATQMDYVKGLTGRVGTIIGKDPNTPYMLVEFKDVDIPKFKKGWWVKTERLTLVEGGKQ